MFSKENFSLLLLRMSPLLHALLEIFIFFQITGSGDIIFMNNWWILTFCGEFSCLLNCFSYKVVRTLILIRKRNLCWKFLIYNDWFWFTIFNLQWSFFGFVNQILMTSIWKILLNLWVNVFKIWGILVFFKYSAFVITNKKFD